MSDNVQLVYFNCKENSQSGLTWHTTFSHCDEALFDFIKSNCENDPFIIVINKQAVLPDYWQVRLLQPLLDNKEINCITALTTEIYELSPLADGKVFNGDERTLDHAIFVAQQPQTFITTRLNPHVFALRNLSSLDQPNQIYACNNLLIQEPKHLGNVMGASAPEIGNQNPLPAHPLAKLHWFFSQEPGSVTYENQVYPNLNQKPNLLHVVMDWGGGVQKWLEDFIANQTDFNHYILASHGELFRQRYGEKLKLYFQSTESVAINEFHLSQPIAATTVSHQEYKMIFSRLLMDYGIQAIVVSSVIGHAMDCLNSGLPTIRVLHDYFPHWPSLQAELDKPEITTKALDLALEKTSEEPFGSIGKNDLIGWQKANNRLLSQPHVKIVAPDQSVVNNLLKLESSACYKNATVIPHGVPQLSAINYQNSSDKFKVLVLGRVNKPKGEQLLHECIKQLSHHHDIAFILLGAGDSGARFKHYPNAVVIKHFSHKKLRELVAEYSPQLALMSSLASETFSYALSELQMLGLPVLATRSGALANRIQDGNNGFLVNKHGKEIADKITALMPQTELLKQVSDNAKNTQQPDLLVNKAQYLRLLAAFELNPPAYKTQGLLSAEPFIQRTLNLSDKNSQLTNRILSLESEVVTKQDWALALDKQTKHLEHNLELERKETTHLQNIISTLQQKLAFESNAVKSTQQKLAETQQALTETSQTLKETQVQLTTTQQTLTSRENELNEVYNSRSWRMTKPIRTFTTWARHKRNAIKFRFNQLTGLPKRVRNSLKTRGLKDTAKIAAQKLKKDQKPVSTVQAHEIKEYYQPLTVATTTDPTVSIIIPVYNQYKHTYHCLESLASLQDKTPFEVIVVNDCSTDDTQQQLTKISGITAHTQKQNGGFIESCNTGASLAKGSFLLFLNNDTEVLPGWLDSLVSTFEAYPDAGLVGSQLIYPDGRLQEAGGIVFADASGWNYGRFDSPDAPEFQHVREVSYCSGASIIIKKTLFDDLGQFDQRYKPAYYEDTDLAFAVRKKGLKVYYQPLSKIIHFEGISSGTDLSSGTKKYQVVNQQKFLDKWQHELKQQPVAGSNIEQARFQNQPKRVLIMDACTPTPDQDSGSLRMLNLMQIFHELGYQVSFIPENMAHFDHYTTDLQQLGIECVYAPKYHSPIEFLKTKGEVFDLVILSRYYVAKPLMSAIKSYCPQAKTWFDTVDLHYLREQRMAEVANDETLIKAAKKTKQQELSVAAACNLTLVVSPYEQKVLSKENPALKVDVLSNIHEVYGNQKSFQQRRDIMFIGGYQHTPNVDGILWFVEEIFPIISESLPHITLHIIGSKAPKQVSALGDQPNIKFHGFVEDIEPFMQDIRIAVAPLRFGAGVKGKVNMSMSYGQPVVGTKVAVEGMHTTHKQDVMMADEPKEFAQAVIKLYQDEPLWNQISSGGLENVENWFSFNAAKKQIKKILQIQ
ncbi:MAG: glycosyltransferase [Xanthomonadales bacterium]|nr:glycosyltransferase [Xanthomonadales bacterium]